MDGQELRKAVFVRGFKNQREFALAAGINPGVMSGLILGSRAITAAYLPRIQGALLRGPQKRTNSNKGGN